MSHENQRKVKVKHAMIREQTRLQTVMKQYMLLDDGYRPPVDRMTRSDATVLEDGRVVKRFEDGRVQIINNNNGVIHQESADGKLLISLPDGRLIMQEFPGDPMFVHDTNDLDARPVQAHLAADATGRLILLFTDDLGTQAVDVESSGILRTQRLGTPSQTF